MALIVRKVPVDNRDSDIGVVSRVAFRVAVSTRAVTTIALLGFSFLLFVPVYEVDFILSIVVFSVAVTVIPIAILIFIVVYGLILIVRSLILASIVIAIISTVIATVAVSVSSVLAIIAIVSIAPSVVGG